MKASTPNVPLTIKANNTGNTSAIAIGLTGDANYQLLQSGISTGNFGFWMIVLDRTSLKVAANFTFTDATTVPSQIGPYASDSNYMFVLTTQSAWSTKVPTGNLYQWLIKEGAGPALKTVEQAYEALNCSGFAQYCYTIVDVFGPNQGNTFDAYALEEKVLFSALELQAFTVNGKTLYTPVALS